MLIQRLTLNTILTAALFAVALAAAPAGAHLPVDEQEMAVAAALEADPENIKMLLMRANLQRKRGDFDEAIASTLEARRAGADADSININVANLMLEAGFPHAAEGFVELVLAAHPEESAALLCRARVHSTLKMSGAAADDYSAALKSGAAPQAGVVIEAMQAQVLAERPDEALAIADAAMSKVGVVVTIALPAIEIARAEGDPQDALRRIDALLVQAPDHELWLAEKAEILDEAGMEDQARATRERAVALLAKRPAQRKSREMAAIEEEMKAALAAGPSASQ